MVHISNERMYEHTQDLPINARLQPDDRTRQTGEDNRADKCPRHRAREGEMIIFGLERFGYICRGNPVAQNIVDGLDMEGLLDLGIRRDEEVEEDQAGDEGAEERDWDRLAVDVHIGRNTNPEVSSWRREHGGREREREEEAEWYFI